MGFRDADITVYQVLVARRGSPHNLPLQRPAFLAPDSARGYLLPEPR
jgi:hypothetical protein